MSLRDRFESMLFDPLGASILGIILSVILGLFGALFAALAVKMVMVFFIFMFGFFALASFIGSVVILIMSIINLFY